jgi:menaquinone-9 beta-reductase
MRDSTYDAVVIGGGPAGSATAILLAQAGWSVAVVEAKAFPRRKVCGEYLSATNRPWLAKLGVLDQVMEFAGPAVSEVGLIAADSLTRAPLPRHDGELGGFGFSIDREHLDTLLLDRAVQLGAHVLQPCQCTGFQSTADGFRVVISPRESEQFRELACRVLIAAHGSWQPGTLDTQPQRRPPRGDDLFGFKAFFRDANLPPGLMPLVCFADGYGGLVEGSGGRISFSCCIRRDRLQSLSRSEDQSAGAVVLDYILSVTPALARLLSVCQLDSPWLAAGPIRPGVLSPYCQGVFLVGNAAGEAHPAVAEGISMAIQAAGLLAHNLGPEKQAVCRRAARDLLGRQYAIMWKRNFAKRIHAAAAIAHWAMRPRAVRVSLPLVRRYPALLRAGAHLSGKAKDVIPQSGEIRKCR